MSRTIDKTERWVLRAPVQAPVANAFGRMTNRPAVWVRISAADGAHSWGEVSSNFPTVGAEHRARLVGGEGFPEIDANSSPLREEVFPLRIDDGWVTLPGTPGLGVELDLARLRPFIRPTAVNG